METLHTWRHLIVAYIRMITEALVFERAIFTHRQLNLEQDIEQSGKEGDQDDDSQDG